VGAKALLMESSDTDESRINALLEAQTVEFRESQHGSSTSIAEMIEKLDESARLRLGASLLHDGDPNRRIMGSRLIRETPSHKFEAADELGVALFQETDDDVIYWLVAAIALVGAPFTLPKLRELADHRSPGVRYHVASALSASFPSELPEDVKALLLTLSDDLDEEVRFSALFELSSQWETSVVRDKAIELRLKRAVSEGDDRTVEVVSRALAQS
jgi:hypothetical protein